jgi:hypothetical protein
MVHFGNELREKLSKDRTAITVGQYIRRLETLNEGKKLTSMKFLLDYDGIIKKIEEMPLAESTKLSYLTAICATLGCFPKYKKIYKNYQTRMIADIVASRAQNASNEKNEKQKESIIPMAEILQVRKRLSEEIDKEIVTGKDWTLVVQHLLICLYTMTPPRRNKDYAFCFVLQHEPEIHNTERNYYVASTGEFIFNNYKTVREYGQQRFVAPDELQTVLQNYLELYFKRFEIIEDEFPLLVDGDQDILHPVNGITRYLNRAFGKKVSSSALRHIFVSELFADDLVQRKDIADKMAHSIQTQQSIYIKVK